MIPVLALLAVATAQTPREIYWRLVAGYHAQNAAYQASLTSQQKAMQEKLNELSKQINDARSVIEKDCTARGGKFEITDTDIVCKDKTDANQQ